MKLSFVMPVYNEGKNIEELYKRLELFTQRIGISDYEIIFVDDGSKDNSYKVIKGLSDKDKNIKLIKLSRNFGQQLAIMAGIENCIGDTVIVMDSDLQDDPASIDKLYSKYNEKYDVVYAVREKRKENILKRFCFFLFHKLISWIANIPIHKNAGTFSIMSKRVISEIKKMGEYRPYMPGLRAHVGFKSSGVKIERANRYADKGKSFAGLIRLALDTIYSHSFFPMKMISLASILSLLVSVAVFSYILYNKFYFGLFEKNSLFFFLLMLFNTAILFSLVIISEYISMIFEESKKRTRYIIEEKINF